MIAYLIRLLSIYVGTPFNGTDFMKDPVFGWFKPFMDFFQRMTGVAGVFFLSVITIFAVGIYVKTRDVTFVAMWLISASGILGAGSWFSGAPQLSAVFAVVCAIGIAALIVGLVLHMKR